MTDPTTDERVAEQTTDERFEAWRQKWRNVPPLHALEEDLICEAHGIIEAVTKERDAVEAKLDALREPPDEELSDYEVVIEAAIAECDRWLPIDDFDPWGLDGLKITLHDPALIDPDFNPLGVCRGFYTDEAEIYDDAADHDSIKARQERGEIIPSGWVGAVWDSSHDCYLTKVIHPTHFQHITPPEAGLC